MTLLDFIINYKKIVVISIILLIGLIFISWTKPIDVTGQAKCSSDRIYFSNGTSLNKSQLTEWEINRYEDGNHITFTNNSYSLSLVLDPYKEKDFWWEHGGICYFPDSAGYKDNQTYGEVVGAFEIPKYVELTLDNGSTIRRGKIVFSTQLKVKDSEMICYKSTTSSQFDNSLIGYITINYPPNNPDPKLLTQIDGILSSLKKNADALCATE